MEDQKNNLHRFVIFFARVFGSYQMELDKIDMVYCEISLLVYLEQLAGHKIFLRGLGGSDL